MYVYYTIATVHAVATSKGIRLFIDIPLRAADRYFVLYQVHSFPFFHMGVNRFIMVDEPFSYIAVAENRQFFFFVAVMTPHKGKRAIPLQAWGGPEGSSRLRLPYFKTIGT